MKKAKCVAVLGTGSEVGKSVVCTALCRMVRNLGLSVAPFKAQNMSNNSYVTIDGGEMGRAQAVQAHAAGIEPHVDMNPVLVKPSVSPGSQIIVHGKVIGDCSSQGTCNDADYLFGKACESLKRLQKTYEVIIIEGAGSCAEVNLRERDYVNFRMARAAGAPVILVADIDRGGVFAQIVGTLEVLPIEDREMIKGIIINRFRGDIGLFADGVRYIEERTRLPVLGVIPYFNHIHIDHEDSVVLDFYKTRTFNVEKNKLNIAILHLPHISNFTDFSVFQNEAVYNLCYLREPQMLEEFDLVILPGTKNVRHDLGWMGELGWDTILRIYVQQGGSLCGICGGYQMLGNTIHDPTGVEGDPGDTLGLGFLDLRTTLNTDKILTRVSGTWLDSGERFEGYEIHMGTTIANESLSPAVQITLRNGESVKQHDGAVSGDGKVWGCYIHGFFDAPGIQRSLLKKLRPELSLGTISELIDSPHIYNDHQYDLLADHFTANLNVPLLWKIAGLGR